MQRRDKPLSLHGVLPGDGMTESFGTPRVSGTSTNLHTFWRYEDTNREKYGYLYTGGGF